jgi:hypothetical protein
MIMSISQRCFIYLVAVPAVIIVSPNFASDGKCKLLSAIGVLDVRLLTRRTVDSFSC